MKVEKINDNNISENKEITDNVIFLDTNIVKKAYKVIEVREKYDKTVNIIKEARDQFYYHPNHIQSKIVQFQNSYFKSLEEDDIKRIKFFLSASDEDLDKKINEYLLFLRGQ